MNCIYFGDNLPIIRSLRSGCVDLIYIDPPFNTGKSQSRTQIAVRRSAGGNRRGFQGELYESVPLETKSYEDRHGDDYIAFLEPRLQEAYRVLSAHGTLYFHIDYREVSECRVLLDEIFGRTCLLNEVIWAYDYGGRTKKKWPEKHDNILVYAKNPHDYKFDAEAAEQVAYKMPAPNGAIRTSLTDVWWHTIVPTNSKEKTGYPTQKPLGLLNRVVAVSSGPGDLVLDFFAGSGTIGETCLKLNRQFILIDNNLQAMQTMARRFRDAPDIVWQGFDPVPHQKVHRQPGFGNFTGA